MGLEDNETYFQVSRDDRLYQAYPRLFTLNIFHTWKVNKSDLAKLLCSYVSEWNAGDLSYLALCLCMSLTWQASIFLPSYTTSP